MTRPLAFTRLQAVAPKTYQATVLEDSPIAYWRCNESAGASTLADVSGNSRTLTLNGTVTTGVAGKNSRMGNSATFGANGYGTVASNTPFQLTGSMAVSFWLYPTSLPGGQRHIMSCLASGETEATNVLYQLAWGQNAGVQRLLAFHEFGAGTNITTVAVDVPIAQDQWQHIAIVRDNTALAYRFYRNGALVGSGGYSSNPTGGTSTTFNFGRLAISGSEYIDSGVDEVAIFNAVLSASRIFEHYRAGRRAA